MPIDTRPIDTEYLEQWEVDWLNDYNQKCFDVLSPFLESIDLEYLERITFAIYKFSISEELKKLPDLPGVYLMYDENDQLIYVGKAISLRKRVRQYFNNDKNKHPKVVVLVENIVRFEYILVDNEVEALVLESNLIKKNRPKYNVLMRDDKQYPYIKIVKEKFPRVVKVRRVEKTWVYFGPYP